MILYKITQYLISYRFDWDEHAFSGYAFCDLILDFERSGERIDFTMMFYFLVNIFSCENSVSIAKCQKLYVIDLIINFQDFF